MLSRIRNSFFIIITAAVFTLGGCSPERALKQTKTPLPPATAPTQPPQTDLPPTQPDPTESGIWDVRDIDISKIDKNRKLISFTFDDAPLDNLERILAVFLSYNAEHTDCPAAATLFCNGEYIDDNGFAALQTAHAMNFELGNHTHTHKNLSTLTMEETKAEISQTDEILERIDGKPHHLLRAPYGRVSDYAKQIAKAPIMDWYIDTVDWTGVSEEAIYNSVFSNKSSGAIVLMHDGCDPTVEALKRLLPDLYEAGYQVVSVSQMAKAHDCPLKIGGVYTRARKPSDR
ncbi:MAG: polysaccharide deacetylase family protein [Clostridia bacterium]|nr:polysaccharide deacetylase family protein [Clostridia bacterium]